MSYSVRVQNLLRALSSGSRWQDLPRADVLLVCNDSDRSYRYRGRAYSPILDTLGDILRESGLRVRTIANRWSSLLGSKAHGEPVSMSRSLLAGRLLPSGPRKGNEDHETRLWGRVLSQCCPRIVLAIQPDPALCRAARSQRIGIFDVQHGVISTVPETSYYRRDTTTNWTDRYPDGVLCWDYASYQELKQGGVGRPGDRVLGHPWLARFATPHPGDALVQAELSALPPRDTDCQAVLVTLQYGQRQFSPEYVPNGVLSDCLAEVIDAFHPGRRWMLRLHPSQLAGLDGGAARGFLRTRYGGRDDVEWELASSVALPALLSQVDVHLTHYSAVAKEASLMGLPTGAVDPELAAGGSRRAYFEAELVSGWVTHLPLDPDVIDAFLASPPKPTERGAVATTSLERLATTLLSLAGGAGA